MPKAASKLTETALKALKPGQWRSDGAVPGLLAHRHGRGVSFAWRYQWGGRRQLMTLGEWLPIAELLEAPADGVTARLRPDAAERLATGKDAAELVEIVIQRDGKALLGLEEARDAARELRKRLGRGENPAEQRRADWRQVTLGEALELYLDSGKARSARTVEGYRRTVARNLGDWQDRPLAGLSPREVHDRHREIGQRGTYEANAAMRVLRAIYNRARKVYPGLPANPADAVDWFEERQREAAIAPADLPRWWSEVEALANPVRRDLYTLLLLTGLRRETAVSVRLEDLDLEAATLRVPRPKGGEARAFTVPLPAVLLPVLRARIAGNAAALAERNAKRVKRRLEPLPASPWLFPADSASGHVSEPKPGAEDGFTVSFTPHGLRHTYISAGTAAGVHPYALKLLTNHALPRGDVTAGYVRADVEALRPEQERVAAKLLEWAERRLPALAPAVVARFSAGKVVPLRAAVG